MLTMATPTLEKQMVTPNSPAQQPLQSMATPSSAMSTNSDPGISGSALTVRLIMQGKEVGSIIGKKGEIVKRFRDESGAKINISDGSCPERIVTVTGATDAIYKAFTLICNKFEEDLANLVSPNTVPRPPITFRLIVPASQCGSLIGKGGSKIKEIREVTGASIQVASEMLPNSTERAVTISGNSEAITQCVYHICLVMSESPPKGATVPCQPSSSSSSSGPPSPLPTHSSYLTPADSQEHLPPSPPLTQSPHPPYMILTDTSSEQASSFKSCLAFGSDDSMSISSTGGSYPGNGVGIGGANAGTTYTYHKHNIPKTGKLGPIPLAGLSNLNGLAAAAAGFGNSGALNPAALAALAASGHNRPQSSQQTHEMTVPNELIGCIIGKGGSKIAEIRQLSGAMIRISNCEEREPGSNTDRTITMSGNAESVALAQYLINM
eukprot:TCALIF_04436-PA protein Name:"Similar to PCBP3 Poly(rC)-binding protein 3 (Homo sapiens)" AED:0.24 eAED:0.24 QI:339/0.85/0.75/1/0.57/0.75/8/0/436